MKPWLLIAGDFTPFGGMDCANYALARYLAAHGEVHLVTHRVWPDLASLPQVRVHHVARPLGWHVLGGALLSRAGHAVWRTLAPRGVRAVVNGGNCALNAVNWLHYLHAAYAPVTIGSLARRSNASLARTRDLAAERRALQQAPVVICNSRRTREDVVERLGVDAARAHVVYYGADPFRFSLVTAAEQREARQLLGFPVDRPLIGFVGALGDRRKAFDTVFRAWSRLCRRPAWDADLIVVGSGAEGSAWRRRAREAGLETRMHFTGYRQDVPAILASLDALVHPARYEAYGLSVHEALCRGVPALVTASAGVAERYPPELADLLIADPDDDAEVVERLTCWREQSGRFRAMVPPLSRQLLSRTWDDMAAEIAALVGGAEAA